jgi:hypothetical protein
MSGLLVYYTTAAAAAAAGGSNFLTKLPPFTINQSYPVVFYCMSSVFSLSLF